MRRSPAFERDADSASIGVLYVSDSPTVSGAEHVLFDHLKRFRAPGFRTHVFLRASNDRLRKELESRGVPFTASEAFSSRTIRTTLRPDHLWTFARAMYRVRRELVALAVRERTDVLHLISYPASLYVAFAARALGVRRSGTSTTSNGSTDSTRRFTGGWPAPPRT